jgi:hypothetical protein
MKSKLIALTACMSVFFTSCDAIDDLLTFNISNEASIKIKSTSPINLPSEIITPEVTTNSSSEFENNNTKASLVKDVKLRSLKLAISDPSNSIDLICTDRKLDEYIKANSYKIRTKVTLKETLTKDVTVKADMKFRVTADPF